MKKPNQLLLATLLATPLLTQCIVVDENGNLANPPSSNISGSAPSYGQPLTAKTGPGSVTIREGSRVVSSFRTASPNVEQTRWHSEQQQIVVKSRGNHGPATVQLFNSRTGREVGRVMAYDIRGGKPRWAAGMGE